ncbi:MAG TPA: HEAT repeat domain-containing protein [Planctomycetaceae bacterium]|nr:HEAT repeat domain-containing protein [Planctomycetaceae bacterium]
MPDPVALTFDYLATTENAYAVDILLPALDVDDDRIRTAAATALVRRRSSRAHIELVRRLHKLPPETRTAIARHLESMESALRQCLSHGDEQLRTNALEMIRWLEAYALLPPLLTMLEHKNLPNRSTVEGAIRELIDRLYDHLHNRVESAEPNGGLRDAQRVCEQVVTALEIACQRIALHKFEFVVEGLLALTDIDHFALKKLLRQPEHPCRDIIDQLLLTSTHPGVMSRITEYMSQNYPPQRVMQAFRQRTDLEFITHVLRAYPRRPTEVQEQNYKQITTLAWLRDAEHFDMIAPALQKRLAIYIQQTGVPDKEKLRVMEWLVKHGCPEGRQAATEFLADKGNDLVQEIVVEGLYAEDPEVQAWATTQLRSRGIPQAFGLLIERLDSPVEGVQEAARHELGDFNLKRVLDLYDQLDQRTCVLAGRLIQKIDPDVLNKLRLEMGNPMRSKRIRAVKAAVAMGLQLQVADTIVRLVEDPDALIRRTAVEILSTIPTPESFQALERMLEDPSVRVREEAARSLQQIRRQHAVPLVEAGHEA